MPLKFDFKIQRIKGECDMMKASVSVKSCYCDLWQTQITEQEKTSVIFYTLLLETYNKLQTVPVWFLISSVWELQIIIVNPV